MRLVSKCFEDEEDSQDSDSGFDSASESDADDAATEMKPREPQNVKETYLVSAEMVCLLLPRVTLHFVACWQVVLEKL